MSTTCNFFSTISLSNFLVAGQGQAAHFGHVSMVSGKIVQLLTTISGCFGALAMGTIIGYSSPAGVIFLRGEGPIKLTDTQNAWVSSISTIGSVLGSPLAGFAMKNYGRRLSLIWSIVPYITGWTFIATAQSVSMLIIGRLICGAGMGLTTSILPIFIAEYASPDIRGALGSIFQMMVSIGILYAYVVGIPLASFRSIAVVCMIPIAVQSVGLLFCKESPTFLLTKGQDSDAKDALQFYRGQSVDVTEELAAMKRSLEKRAEFKMTFGEFVKPGFLKSFLIAMGLIVFLQASGINAVLFNMSTIFQEAGTSLDANTSSLIVSAILLVSGVVCSLLVEKLGRKPLLMISSVFMSLSFVCLGTYFFIKSKEDEHVAIELASNFGWLPMVSLMVFCAAFTVGFGTVPFIMLGELFPTETREFATSLTFMMGYTTSFIVTVTFVPLQSVIGAYGMYWTFAAICALSFFFCYFIVPETKGIKIQDIPGITTLEVK